MKFQYVMFLIYLTMITTHPAFACISEILKPTKTVQVWLDTENQESLTNEQQEIIRSFKRDEEYYTLLSVDRCHIISLSEEQFKIQEEIRQLILKKWTYKPSVNNLGISE